MSEKKPTPPYQTLGRYLRDVREKLQESVAEVSGAVEIDADVLERIEQGIELPSEDILMLLISHFGMRDDEAVSVWELAGYSQEDRPWQDDDQPQDFHGTKQPVVMLYAMDARVVYSNGIEVTADDAGVTMNFTQHSEQKQGPISIARVGMSHDQAEKVLHVLQQAMLRHKYLRGPKGLPEPKSKRRTRTDDQNK